jgi:hypothetical protein
MANQYAQRNWKQEMANTAARLSMCVFVPNHLTALTRVRCSCPHGVVKETTVIRFVERQFCCKSQASKAHDPEQKRKAAVKSWVTGKEKHLQARRQRWDNPDERVKHSEIMKGVENSWIPTSKQRLLPGTLYLIRYLDESGTHFKLGITRLTLSERFRKGQLISIIHLHTSTLGECFDLEQDCLRYCKQQGWRYSSPTTTELIHPDGLPYLLDRLTALYSAGKAGYNKLS